MISSAAVAAMARAVSDTQAIMAAVAGVDTDHGACCRDIAVIAAGSPTAYPARSPASPQVLVSDRSTTIPSIPPPVIKDSGSPGTASMNASSITSSRPGRAS